MKRSTATMLAAMALALTLIGSAHARQDDIDINRLSSSLDQLANDPGMGSMPRPSRRAHAMRSTGWPRPARANGRTRCTWPNAGSTWPRRRRSCRTPRSS